MHAYQLQGRTQFWYKLLTEHSPTVLESCLAANVAAGAPMQCWSLLLHLLSETDLYVLTYDSSPATTQMHQLGFPRLQQYDAIPLQNANKAAMKLTPCAPHKHI